MAKTRKHLLMKTYLFLLTLVVLALPVSVTAQKGIKGSIWDVPDIDKTPAYTIVSRDSAIGLIYEGLPYQGHTQHVFAYYASPATLYGTENRDKHFPAIVLVHGGGGKAFKHWAIMWARKGYAAIAMDLRGNGPDGEHIKNGFIEENHETPYFKITPTLNDQWMYQAVADVILAHNLICHFPEVDSNCTALTGISWGGVITCLLAGLDDRLKVAVPVYGCGYLWESGRMEIQLNQLSVGDRTTWIKQYDPSNYMMNATMPVLFLNDANDPFFVLKSYMKTCHEVRHKNLSIKIHLEHSHSAGWSNREIYAFINHYINKSPALPVIEKPVRKGHKIVAKIYSPINIEKAFLNYTTDTLASETDRKWNTMEVKLENKRIVSPVPPKGTKIWYLSAEDKRELKVSGVVQFIL